MDDLSSSTILLVEDSEADIVLLKRALRNARIANPLMVVRDGEEAINYFSAAGVYGNRERWPIPSLVLLDLRLPKVSGFHLPFAKEDLSSQLSPLAPRCHELLERSLPT